MRWEDEPYVRIYTRDTPDWVALPWQARFVFNEAARKADRAGIIPMGKSGMRGLAALLMMPPEVLEVGLDALVTDGCIARVGDGIIIRNFVAAQNAGHSDRVRKAMQRERDRVDALSKPLTSSDEVTVGHTESQASQLVTTCHSFLSISDLSISEKEEPGSSEPGLAPNGPGQESSPEPAQAPEREVFEHWLAGWKKHVHGTRAPILDQKRRSKIRARLAEKFSLEDLKLAVDGLWSSSWHIEKRRTDIELVCRDAPHVESFIDLAKNPARESGVIRQFPGRFQAQPRNGEDLRGKWDRKTGLESA